MSGTEKLGDLVRFFGMAEIIRWISTQALAALLMITVLIVIVGVARHSRCTLITYVVN